MDLAGKFDQGQPWPARDGRRVLFILDARNSFEAGNLLQQWIHHHRAQRQRGTSIHRQVCLATWVMIAKPSTARKLMIALALPWRCPLWHRCALPGCPTQRRSLTPGLSLRNLSCSETRVTARCQPGPARLLNQHHRSSMRLIAGAPDSPGQPAPALPNNITICGTNPVCPAAILR